MNYSNLKLHDVANGVGVRVSLFVSGCEHSCPGCFNPEAWQFSFGEAYTEAVELRVLAALEPPHMRGLTLLGGEPLHPKNRGDLLALVQRVRRELPEKDIWCYTGYVFDKELLPQCQGDPVLRALLQGIDVLVDGRFVEARKSLNLRFRGSENQRLILARESMETGRLCFFQNEK